MSDILTISSDRRSMECAIAISARLQWDGEERRSAERIRLALEARISNSALRSAYIVVVDISTDGFAFTGFEMFRPGTTILLDLPSLEPQSAEVVWDDGLRTGCRFHDPLSEQELEAVLRRY